MSQNMLSALRAEIVLSAVTFTFSAIFSTFACATEPRFDCDKARSWSERQVCDNITLAYLDRQIALLHDKKKKGKNVDKNNLVNDQRRWLVEREDCQNTDHQLQCLTDLYNIRISQLSASATDTVTPTGNNPTTYSAKITPSVVWSGNIPDCQFDDISCLTENMKKGGASDEAVRFAKWLAQAGDPGWAEEFHEFDSVDLVSTV